jgi:hypothetical protein
MTDIYSALMEVFTDNVDIIIFLSVIVLVVYMMLFKVMYRGFFDPLFLAIVSMAFAAIIPWYMIVNNLFFDENKIIQYIGSEFCICFGMLLFGKYNFLVTKKYFYREMNHSIENYVFKVLSLTYILLTVLYYGMNGIPVFAEGGRLAITQSAYNFIEAPINAIRIAFLFFLVKNIVHRWTLYNLTVLIFTFITFVFSGARGSFILLGYSVFFVALFLQRTNESQNIKIANLINKKIKYMIFLLPIFTLFTIFITKNDFFESVSTLLIRVVSQGDGYIYYYGANWHNGLDCGEWYSYFIYPTLAKLRIIPFEECIDGLGFQIFRESTGIVNAIVGPNMRHNIIGDIYFGMWGSFIYSFVCGVLIGFITRFIDYYKRNFNTVTFCIYVQIYYSITQLPLDYEVAVKPYEIIMQICFSLCMYMIYKVLRFDKMVIK